MKWVIGAFILAAFSAPAMACDCISFVETGPHFERDIQAVVDSAAVIADGIIVRPMGTMLEPALFKPSRVLKGPRRASYLIGLQSDCGLLLKEPDVTTGESVRLILYGGPDVYEATRCVNFKGAAFNSAVARRIGADCRSR